MAKFQQKTEEQGREQWHASEIGKLYNKVWSEYIDKSLATEEGRNAAREAQLAELEDIQKQLEAA